LWVELQLKTMTLKGGDMKTKRAFLSTVAVTAVGLASWTPLASAQELRIGVLASLEGSLTPLGHEALRGVRLALSEVNETVAGRKVVLFTAPTNATPDSAINGARRLIEQDKVEIVIGPVSGSEGLAVVQFAKSNPGITFVNGTAAAPEATYREPATNFFRFNADGVMWQAGLGTYAYNDMKYRRVASLANDYSFGWAQMKGFSMEFCRSGGKIAERLWTPIGTTDFSSLIARIPKNVDALYVMLVGADATNFITQYVQAGAPVPIIAGTNTVDQTVLATLTRKQLRDFITGTPSASPVVDDWSDPRYQQFVSAYKKAFPDGLPSPASAGFGYYVNTKAVLQALNDVKGDLSNNQQKFRAALSKVVVEGPAGAIRLDDNRQGDATIFLTTVKQGADGKLYNSFVKATRSVTQTMGMNREAFIKLGVPTRDTIQCP
jgi:branched-chain amino acid transport system substrate-binding protein